jgi:hypothetical protein
MAHQVSGGPRPDSDPAYDAAFIRAFDGKELEAALTTDA